MVIGDNDDEIRFAWRGRLGGAGGTETQEIPAVGGRHDKKIITAFEVSRVIAFIAQRRVIRCSFAQWLRTPVP